MERRKDPVIAPACRHDEIAGDCQRCVADGISGLMTFCPRRADELMALNFDLKVVGPQDDDIITIKATVQIGVSGSEIKVPRYAILQSKFTRESLRLSRLTPQVVLELVRDNMVHQMRAALIDGIQMREPLREV